MTDEKPRLFIRSSSMSDFEMLMILRDFMQGLHDAGYETIDIVDKDSNRRNVNLTILN